MKDKRNKRKDIAVLMIAYLGTNTVSLRVVGVSKIVAWGL